MIDKYREKKQNFLFLINFFTTSTHLFIKKGEQATLSAFFYIYLRLKFGVSWGTWEWDYIANVSHTCHEQQQTFKAETETGMRT